MLNIRKGRGTLAVRRSILWLWCWRATEEISLASHGETGFGLRADLGGDALSSADLQSGLKMEFASSIDASDRPFRRVFFHTKCSLSTALGTASEARNQDNSFRPQPTLQEHFHNIRSALLGRVGPIETIFEETSRVGVSNLRACNG